MPGVIKPSCVDIGFAKLDLHRRARKGFGEVVFCKGKTMRQISAIAKHLSTHEKLVLLTKAEPEVFENVKASFPYAKYNNAAKIIAIDRRRLKAPKKGLVVIITAGTSDIAVAEEAAFFLEVSNNNIKRLYDAGVAGIHRLFDRLNIIKKAKVIIVVAGMEGALASVVAGLSKSPIIAVPTSVGYGASFKGLSALLTMLNCCAPGVAVMNIDNGFGAGYFANLINKK